MGIPTGLRPFKMLNKRPRYRSEEYDTSRDPENPLSAGLQVLFGSMTKFMTDMGDVVSEVFDMPSGRQRYAYFNGRHQNKPVDWLKRHESIPVENQDVGCPGTSVMFADGRHTARGGSSSGRSKRSCLPTAAARTIRLAQRILDIIIIPPMEVSLTLAKGLRSPHSLFHEDGARNSPTVRGIRSGLRAARTVRMRSGLESYPVCGAFSSSIINFAHRSSCLVFTTVLRD